MIDIHTHLLPGVDDGSPNAAHSALVLERMAGEGVTHVVCTPHLDASRAAEAPWRAHERLREELQMLSPPGVELAPGWEIMLDAPGIDLGAPGLALGTSRARLVEFPRRGLPPWATEELVRLKSAGLVPVVAHPERYACSLDLLGSWYELGAVLQIDAMGALSAGPMGELARAMLAEGLAGVLASDNHGDRRSLSTARLWLEEIEAPHQAELLTRENPRRLLDGRDLMPVEPVRFASGVFDRLKAWVGQLRRGETDRDA